MGTGVTRSATENTLVTSRPLARLSVVILTTSCSITKLRSDFSSTMLRKLRTDSCGTFSVTGRSRLIFSASIAESSHENGSPVLVCRFSITSDSGTWLNSTPMGASSFRSISIVCGVRLRR